jgi:hypothetical protein
MEACDRDHLNLRHEKAIQDLINGGITYKFLK